jgi:hypothetical protein
MGQCEPKERGLKQGFEELQGERPKRIKMEKRSNEGCVSPTELTEHLTPNFFLSKLYLF